MTFTPISKIIPKAVKTAGITIKLDEAKLLENFDKVAVAIFGERVLKKIKPLYIKNGTLMVACLSDILAENIKHAEKKFLYELNKPFRKGVIEKIRFLA